MEKTFLLSILVRGAAEVGLSPPKKDQNVKKIERDGSEEKGGGIRRAAEGSRFTHGGRGGGGGEKK